MDIRKPQTTSTEPASSQPSNNDVAKFKTGSVPHSSGRLMLPPAIQATLTTIGQKYGLPLDLNEVSLDGTLAEKIAATRKIVDLAKADSKLLPEMMKLIKSLLKSELKLSDFHRKLSKEAIRYNVQMDKNMADIFLQMAGYKAKSAKLEHRTNLRSQLKEKRTQAYLNYYSDSVFGEESKIIDVEFETLSSNQKILSESKQERIKLESDRKQKLAQYINSAYQ
jgi:hypothetical protein